MSDTGQFLTQSDPARRHEIVQALLLVMIACLAVIIADELLRQARFEQSQHLLAIQRRLAFAKARRGQIRRGPASWWRRPTRAGEPAKENPGEEGPAGVEDYAWDLDEWPG